MKNAILKIFSITLLIIIFGLFVCSVIAQTATPAVAQPDSVYSLLLGDTPIQLYIAASIFSLIGIGINTGRSIMKGIKTNEMSPNSFSWQYFWRDSSIKIVSSVVVNLLMIRFITLVTPDSFETMITNDWILAVCLVNGVLGYGIDWLMSKIKSKTTWLDAPQSASETIKQARISQLLAAGFKEDVTTNVWQLNTKVITAAQIINLNNTDFQALVKA